MEKENIVLLTLRNNVISKCKNCTLEEYSLLHIIAKNSLRETECLMTKERLYSSISEKYKELKQALQGTDLERIKELTLEVHAMVHPAEISGKSEKTIADIRIKPIPLNRSGEKNGHVYINQHVSEWIQSYSGRSISKENNAKKSICIYCI